jgi:uncharacterized membrane protein
MDSPAEPLTDQPFCCVVAPDGSLTVRAAWGFGLVACLPIVVGAFWAGIMGLWPILPFSGLESLAVLWTLRHCLRRNAYREVIRIESGRIQVESGRKGPEQVTIFERPWARVRLDSSVEPSRLWLVCRDRRVELGRGLIESERRRLANRLNEVMASGAVG